MGLREQHWGMDVRVEEMVALIHPRLAMQEVHLHIALGRGRRWEHWRMDEW
jgi:hypothetical protein